MYMCTRRWMDKFACRCDFVTLRRVFRSSTSIAAATTLETVSFAAVFAKAQSSGVLGFSSVWACRWHRFWCFCLIKRRSGDTHSIDGMMTTILTDGCELS